jgi:hypothetical protein
MEPATWVSDATRLHRFDVCNGDADGLCAVRQWRLHAPAEAELITGLKREIDLLRRVPIDLAAEVLVCDLSLQRNRVALQRLLDAGTPVRYFDHHDPGADVPTHPRLALHVDQSSQTCSSLLMDRHLDGRFRAWALVGAYGDNLSPVADALAVASGFDAGQRASFKRLGEAINYNAYGECASDVCIAPAALYALMARHADPLHMLADEPVIELIERQRAADLQQALALTPYRHHAQARLTLLPDAPWSRRVIGSLANELANAHPQQAQAVLKIAAGGNYTVSVRAPQRAPHGASELCAGFGGSGRAAAAGIDQLPAAELDRFARAFEQAWSRPPA